MKSWPEFVEKQKGKLMTFKDRFCLPLAARLPKRLTCNTLTYLRFLAAFTLYLLFAFQVDYLLFYLVILYLAAKFTDMLDGGLARIRGQAKQAGEFLDTLADKFFYLIGFFVLAKRWPDILAFHYLFIMLAISLGIVLFNRLRSLINKQAGKKSRMTRQLFEGVGYLVAILMFVIQVFL